MVQYMGYAVCFTFNYTDMYLLEIGAMYMRISKYQMFTTLSDLD